MFTDPDWAPGFDRPRVATGLSEEDMTARCKELQDLRRSRDQQQVANCLRKVRAAAAGGANTFPAILSAVEAYATIGEICDELREVWGTHDR